MEKLIATARIAWNPIGAVRERLRDGKLSLGAVLIPFLTVVISCNLVAGAAQQFFYESMAFGMGTEIPNHPLVNNSFAQRFLSALGVVVPALVVWLLPQRYHYPVGRSSVIASIFIIAAAWAFYGALIVIPVYFIAGAIATGNAQAGLVFLNIASIPITLFIVGLVLWFWFRVLIRELQLKGTSVAMITFSAISSLVLVALLFWSLLS